jgi:16S rRNA (adenine1518-N6/adenine1519-N6)-dimethyltransferase
MPPKSRLGQNFLRDQTACARIASALGPLAGRTVVEIGPGQGAITHLLAAEAGHLIAVELDHSLALQLRVALPSVEVVEQDVLEFDFAAAAEKAGGKLLVVGNLPYYITSPILLKLAASHASIERAVVMVQREVADRVTAHPGSRDYGVLTVTAQMYGPVEPLFTLPPAAFSPPPEVHSSVFRWNFSPRFEELQVEEKPFLSFVKQAFAQKRKTLANNLRSAGFAPGQAVSALAESGIEPQARAEALGLMQLAEVWKRLSTAR